MSESESNWRELAIQFYREARTELLARQDASQRPELEYYIEELNEALLDLKLAVQQDREVDAHSYVDEVLLLLAELRLRSQE